MQLVMPGQLPVIGGLVAASVAPTPPMVLVPAPQPAAHDRWRQLAGVLGDVALVVLPGVLFPVAILAVGTPVALAVLLVIEVVTRF